MDAVKILLLKRRDLLCVPETKRGLPFGKNDVAGLEAALAELGYVMTGELRAALQALPGKQFKRIANTTPALLAQELGAHRPHVPLFRKFRSSLLRGSEALFARRVLAYLWQEPEQPCFLCATIGSVHAVKPCAHLICRVCWDGSDYSGCPICNRRLDPDDPFLLPTEPPPDAPDPSSSRLRILHVGRSADEAGLELLGRLVRRTTPPSPSDRDALDALVGHFRERAIDRLPERIPVKETMAQTVGLLLRTVESARERLHAVFGQHARTATDVLRVTAVWMGGAPDLLEAPKPMPSMPRWLRRLVIERLGALDARLLVEDVQRHAGFWKRVGERLHPFEWHARHPGVAAAFAVLRRTPVETGTALGATLARTAAEDPGTFRIAAGRLRFVSWASRVEEAFREQRPDDALRLLGERPGELLRRFDHLLRETIAHRPATADGVLAALDRAAPRASTPLVLTLMAHVAARTKKAPKRVFFPRGDVTHAYALPDARPTLPSELVHRATRRLEQEALSRAAGAPPVRVAFLDEALGDLVVPFNERTSSRALVSVPRGSTLPIPDGEFLRFFVHWTDPPGRVVDLDLSVSLYDYAWQFKGLCDYTELTFGDDAAVHSGDLTSAPAPLGSSEFIDLDVASLVADGVQHLVAVVFSFNDVPFDQLTDAFAGFMLRTSAAGKVFDARAVEQRFDLQGAAKIAVPLTIDLHERRMRWLDVKAAAAGYFHSVGGYKGALARLGQDFAVYFGSGTRATLWQLACLHAAARAERTDVRRRDGEIDRYERGDATVEAYFRRMVGHLPPDARLSGPLLGDEPVFAAVVRDDVPLPDGSEVYALRYGESSAERVKRISAADLVAALGAPRADRTAADAEA